MFRWNISVALKRFSGLNYGPENSISESHQSENILRAGADELRTQQALIRGCIAILLWLAVSTPITTLQKCTKYNTSFKENYKQVEQPGLGTGICKACATRMQAISAEF